MIYLDHSNIDYDDAAMVTKALFEGQVSTAGRYVAEFEQLMRDYFGRSVVALNSGTAALFLALKAFGIKKGDSVIIPALTFIGTYNAVKIAGIDPIIRDVDKDDWNLSGNKDYEYADAMIPVDLYGNKFTRSIGIITIIDACESFGIQHINCDAAIYSFNGNKIITTGGGGLIVADNTMVAKTWNLSHQGKYDGVATNMGMTSLSAALGISQFKKLDKFLKIKKTIHEIYLDKLGPYFQFQHHGPDSTYWLNACLLPGDIPTIMSELAKMGIPTRRIFKPLSPDCPNANYIYEHGLCLPSSTLNTESSIHNVCEGVKDVVHRQNNTYYWRNRISWEGDSQ